jgi:diguanylate cyclase (GGDEF)-like protein
MAELQHGEALFVHGCVEAFVAQFERTVVEVLARELRGLQPTAVRELREQLTLLMRQLEVRSGPVRVHEAMSGLLKRVLLSERRRIAESLEVPLAKAIEPNIVGALQREVRRFDDLMAIPWINEAQAQRIPRLTDFLSIRFAAAATPDAPPLFPREYDEKFNVLEAPRLFLPDLAHHRYECELRNAELVVAYVDIDDFKAVNTQLTETVVDLKVLSPLLELMEAWAYARAHAYRFGGDEYVLLLPNATRALGYSLLDELRRRVAGASYSGTSVRLSITLGACVVAPDCPLTNREVLARANLAKARGKLEKKGTIVFVEPPDYAIDSAPLC